MGDTTITKPGMIKGNNPKYNAKGGFEKGWRR
jgi:hypothetical protein